MKMRTLFTANAIVQAMFGVGFLLIPTILLGLFGAQTDATGVMMARVAGSVIISLALVSWLGRDVDSVSAQDAMAWGFILAHFLAGILATLSILSGAFNALGWSSVLIDIVFVVAFLWVRQNRAK
jgi:hypothetical protein